MLTDEEKALVERAKSDFRGPGVGDEDVWWLLKLIDRITTESAILDAAEGILRKQVPLGVLLSIQPARETQPQFASVECRPANIPGRPEICAVREYGRTVKDALSEAVAKLKGGAP